MIGSLRTRRSSRAAAIVIAALALGAGCGSSDGDDADDADAARSTTAPSTEDTTADTSTTTTTGSGGEEEPSGDACDIVSDEVVAAVLGIDVERREPHGDEFGVSCIKGDERTDDPSQFTFVSVGIVTGGAPLIADARAQPDASPVDGLGDEAVFVQSAGVLFIADGDDSIQVQVVRGGVPGTQDEAVTVAEDVLGRL